MKPRYSLILVLALSWILPAEPFTAALALLCLLYAAYSSKRANMAALRLAAPFFLMGIYGLLLAWGNDIYDVGKDGWYAIKLCLCLGVGYLIGVRESNPRATFRLVSYLAALTGLWAIGLSAVSGTESSADGADDVVRLPMFAIAVIPILLEHLRHSAPRAKFVNLAILAAIVLAVAISNSRISILMTLAMILAWAGFLSNWKRAVAIGLPVAFAGVILWHILPNYEGGTLTLAMKIRRSLQEINITDGFDRTLKIWNWRGFETYNAQLMFDHVNIGRKLFGNGLGSTVDIGQTVDMGKGLLYRYLPILHNGYYYILIKYGIFGVFIYTGAVLKFATWSASFQGEAMMMDERLLRGLVISILLATIVITGLYNKDVLNGVTVLAGWLIAVTRRRRVAIAEWRKVSINGPPRTRESTP